MWRRMKREMRRTARQTNGVNLPSSRNSPKKDRGYVKSEKSVEVLDEAEASYHRIRR